MNRRAEDAEAREQRRQAVLERIVSTAMDTICTRGIDALSINGLARALGYTPGALYRYVDGKDALFALLIDRVVDEIRGLLRDSIDAPATARDPLRDIVTLVAAYRRFANDAPNRFGMVSLILAHPRVVLSAPDEAPGQLSQLLRALSPLHDALGRAVGAGLLDAGDATQRSLVVFAATQGVLSLRKQASGAPDLIPSLLADAVGSLLRGWGAPADAVAAALRDALSVDGSG